MSGALQIFCASAPGLEALLLAEVRALGLDGTAGPGGVALAGDAEVLARLNLWLRTCSRVLVRLGSFEARRFPELVHKATALPFARVLRRGQAVALRVTCRKSKLYHSDAVAERVHAAIEARLGGACPLVSAGGEGDGDDAAGEADTIPDMVAQPKAAPPSANALPGGAPPQLLLVRFDHDVCTISADSSGALLHRRGYRTLLSQAPLRETLAAALLLAASYRGGPLLDPCCGAGTIPIEAALIALHRAPGLSRAFAFERWPGHDAKLLARLRVAARRGERAPIQMPGEPTGQPGQSGFFGEISGSDLDARAIDAARANAERAGVAGMVRFEVHPLQQLRAPRSLDGAPLGAGLLACNPPYGKRVGEVGDLRALYAALGVAAREELPGWRAALICADPALAAATGLELHEQCRTQNGGTPVTIFR